MLHFHYFLLAVFFAPSVLCVAPDPVAKKNLTEADEPPASDSTSSASSSSLLDEESEDVEYETIYEYKPGDEFVPEERYHPGIDGSSQEPDGGLVALLHRFLGQVQNDLENLPRDLERWSLVVTKTWQELTVGKFVVNSMVVFLKVMEGEVSPRGARIFFEELGGRLFGAGASSSVVVGHGAGEVGGVAEGGGAAAEL